MANSWLCHFRFETEFRNQRSPEELFVVSFQKENRTALPDLFSKKILIKISADIWCLVIGFYKPAYPMERTITTYFLIEIHFVS